MKKLVSILLALALILSLSTVAFAAGSEKVTLTITGAAGHTYKVYQIFTGKVTEEDGKDVLSNVKFGQHYGTQGGDVPAEFLNTIVNSNDPEEVLSVGLKDSTIVGTPDDGENDVTFENLDPGYYMVVDITADLPEGESKSPIILQVLESTTIASKHAEIVSEKKVDDKNDSTNDEDGENWQDVADYDIGDKVPFKLSVTLPAIMNHYDGANGYELSFHDSYEEGVFGAPDVKAVYVERLNAGGEPEVLFDITNYVVSDVCTGAHCEFGADCRFNIAVNNILALYAAAGQTYAKDDKLVVKYEAELTDKAVAGDAGNINSMFVHHPDGHTAVDSVAVLTYALTVNKTIGGAQNRTLLEGAGFTLYKWIEDAQDYVMIGTEIKSTEQNPITKFVWTGIDGGKYVLKETTTPAGYNTMADLEFVVNATHAEEWLGTNLPLWNLIAKDPTGAVVVFADNDNDVQDGKLEGDIQNFKGAILPETGAEGTFFLIAGGALLIMVAAVFMITRKKMSIYED